MGSTAVGQEQYSNKILVKNPVLLKDRATGRLKMKSDCAAL